MALGRCGMAAALAIAVCGLWPAAIQAAPGDLDPSFGGGDGKVTTDFGGEDGVSDVEVQPDGKILVAGRDDDDDEFVLVRYSADGTPDSSFGGGDGIARNSLISYGKLALLPDGKIMLASSDGDFILARYTSEGALDTSFGGGDGLVETDFGGEADYPLDIVRQSDGKLLLGGARAFPEQFALARHNPDGSLDTSFGGDGKVTTGFGGEDLLVALSVGSDGKIAAAGGTSAGGTPGDEYDFAVARYNADGTLDTGFAGDGTTTLGFDGFAQASGVAALAGGKVLVAGTGVHGEKMQVTLARYTAGGALDASFGGGDGTVASDLGAFGSTAEALAMQADGRIVVAGNGGGASDDLLVVRYNADGSLDTTFGDGDGSVTVDFKGGHDHATALALQSGGIVAAGLARSPGAFDDDFAIARLLSDGVPPPEEEPPEEPEEEPSPEEPPEEIDPSISPTPDASPSPAPAISQQPSGPVRPVLAAAARLVHIKGDRAFMRLRCRGQGACRGVAKLVARVRARRSAQRSTKRARNIVLGRSRFRVPAGRIKILRIHLNRRGRLLLQQAGRRGIRARLVGRGLRNRVVRLKVRTGKRPRPRAAYPSSMGFWVTRRPRPFTWRGSRHFYAGRRDSNGPSRYRSAE